MSAQEQRNLLYELQEQLREGKSPTEVRDLLLKLKRRDDLLAKFAKKIDEALQGLENKADPALESGTPEPSAPPSSRSLSAPRICTRCRAEVELGSKFCRNCGASLEPAKSPTVAEKIPSVPGSESCQYALSPKDNPRLIADIKQWLEFKISILNRW